MENDQDQIALSKLAAQKSSSADVKQFAAETVVVRGRLTGQLESLAKQLKVSKPTKPSKKTRKQIEKLQALSGPSFDSAYLEEIGKLQRKDLDQFRTEVRNSPNAGLRKGIWQDMQILAGRYRTLEKIAKAHNVDLGGKK